MKMSQAREKTKFRELKATHINYTEILHFA
jgi:hypothetical protein